VTGPTPSQTVGPFFHDCLLLLDQHVLARPGTDGRRIRVEGQLRDGDGAPVTDALIEIWQASAAGRYRHPADDVDEPFVGFGRAGTDEDGRYWFDTVKPGRVPDPTGGLQAPHIAVHVLARGLLDQLATRVYFADEPANAEDLVLSAVPEARRGTLLAHPHGEAYRFDIVLQGDGETVFFARRG
jgi:protocatechuate 3,4-dioxygenase alpha subunit